MGLAGMGFSAAEEEEVWNGCGFGLSVWCTLKTSKMTHVRGLKLAMLQFRIKDSRVNKEKYRTISN